MLNATSHLVEARQWYENIWLRSSDRSPQTVRAYISDVKQFVTHLGGDTELYAVSASTIEHWLLVLRQRRYEPATIQRKVASVRLFFDACKARGILAESPFNSLRLRLCGSKRLVRTIGDSDLSRLLEHVEMRVRVAGRRGTRLPPMFELRDRAIVRLFAATGIRAQELASLTMPRISLDNGTVHVAGKGNRERLAFLIGAADISPLAEYLQVRHTLQVAHSSAFVNRTGNPLSTHGVRRILHKLAGECCGGQRLTPHMFRHTAATRLLENGADMRSVQEFLGHASIKSTERYTHVSRRYLRAVIDRCHPLKALPACGESGSPVEAG